MKNLTTILIVFYLWMDISTQIPTVVLDSLDICEKTMSIIDVQKLQETMLHTILLGLKNVTEEQKSLVRG